MQSEPLATLTLPTLVSPASSARHRIRARGLSVVFGAIFLVVVSPFHALAMPIASRASEHTVLTTIETDRLTIHSAIEVEEVANSLAALGYTPKRVAVTLHNLSPQDIHQLATNIQQLQAAGGTRTRIWVAVAIAVVVIVVIAWAQAEGPGSLRNV